MTDTQEPIQPVDTKITQDELDKINKEIEDKYSNIAKTIAQQAVRSAEEEKQKIEVQKLQEQLIKTQQELELSRKENQERLAAITEKLIQRKGVVDNSNPVPPKDPNVVKVTKEQLREEFFRKHGL